MRSLRIATALLAWSFGGSSVLFAADTIVTNQIGRGVIFKHYHYDSLDGGKQNIYITDINLNDPTVSIKFPHLTAGRTVTSHAGTVPNAAVAVNGQFFDASGSVQFLKVSNSIVYPSRAAVHDEQAVTDDGLGHTNSIGIALRPGAINAWTNSTSPNILSCGVALVQNGVKIPDSSYDPNDPYITADEPRTCVGWTYDNHLLLMCVDGRTTNALGMTIYQLRDDFFTRGTLRHAFGLDGGGSTEMWARGLGVCNVPSDGVERAVVDAVVVASAPVAPATLAATTSLTNVSLAWSASAGAASYNLKRSNTNGGPYATIINTTKTGYTNTGLAAGTTFYYIVTALNGAGESSNSVQAAATIASLPSAPTNLTATAGTGLIALSWGTVAGVLNYNVKRSATNGGPYVTITNTAGASFTNTGLAAGATFYYVVSAVSSVGEGSNSTQATATTLSPPPPPANLAASPGDSLAILDWDPVPGVLSYHVKSSLTNGGPYAVIANVVSTNYTNVNLVNGTTYYYVVSAVNSAGEGSNSVQVSVTPLCEVPVAPASLTATLSNDQIVLSWGAAASGTNYAVLRSAALTGSYTALATNLTDTNYADATFDRAAPNFYIVRAMNACGTSADSAVASAPLLITSQWVSGTNFAASGWGGTAGQSFYVLGSADMMAPVSQWTTLATNVFGPAGSFSFTNGFDPAAPRGFYLIQAPLPGSN